MNQVLLLGGMLAIILGGDSRGQTVDESASAYSITAEAAISVLPPDLRRFFDAVVEGFCRGAANPHGTATSPPATAAWRGWHYLKLDVEAGSADCGLRRTAAARFPRQISAARNIFKKHGEANGGTLPWATFESYAALVHAFRGGERDKILREASTLHHLAIDAAMPFNTTFDRDGEATGHLHWSATGPAGDDFAHRTARLRYQMALIDRLQARYRFEVRLSPDRFHAVSDPLEEVFKVLLRAHSTLELLLRIDADLTKRLGLRDSRSFMAAYGSYYAELAEEAAWIMEARLEDGALLSANLIGAAWAEVGSPSPDSFTMPKENEQEAAVPASGGSQSSPAPRQGSPTTYVASRKSKTYHRSGCQHVQRITDTNRVEFSTSREAEATGRKPCRSCLPGVP